MKHNCVTISDDNGIEIIVGYDHEIHRHDPEDQEFLYTELTSVEVVIKGIGIDILPNLNQKQMDYVQELVSEIHMRPDLVSLTRKFFMP